MPRRPIIVTSFVAFVALLGTPAAFGHVSSATVNSKAQLLQAGASVVVSGTIRCDTGEDGSVSVILSQSQGQQSVIGGGGASATCNGSSQGWSVTVFALDEGKFKPGPAAAYVQACSSLPFDPMNPDQHSDCETLNVTVHIRR